MGVFQETSAGLLRSSLTHDEWARCGPRRRTTFLGHLDDESLAALLTHAPRAAAENRP
jgi:hypothetical protein